MKLQIETPGHLIDVNGLALDKIEPTTDGGLRIGALVRNTDLASRRARAARLCRAVSCAAVWRIRPAAQQGDHGGQPAAAHPLPLFLRHRPALQQAASPAVGCSADLHRLPGDTPHLETNLAAGELITAVILPAAPPGGQIYRKARDRASYAGGLASVAVVGQQVAFGAVAHKPWRAEKTEAALKTGASALEAAHAELAGAQDNGKNGFKIALVARMTADALAQASEGRGA
jgi:xanthine dehydrogenase YagS FAD-binding subunit